MTARTAQGVTMRGVVLSVAAVAALLAALIAVRGAAEGAVAALADWLAVGYAFGAGMVASVNPCGFMLLPAYVSYQMGASDAEFGRLSALARVLRAVQVGGAATAGFILVFGVAGGIVAAGGHWLARVFPHLGAAVAFALLGLGLYMLLGREHLPRLPVLSAAAGTERSLRGMFMYGVAYAVGSLGCTLPIFLVVVGSALAAGDLLLSLGQLLGYALGMGAVLVAVALGAALFRGAVARWLRGLVPYTQLLGALFLLAAGGYLLYYWLGVVGL